MTVSLSVRDKLAAARLIGARLLPYSQAALLAMIPREVKGLGTLAVTANGIMLYDPEFVKANSPDRLAAGTLHEAWHLVRDTAGRRGERHPYLWNLGSDAPINDDLRETGADVGEDWVYASTFAQYGVEEGMFAEEIYRLLEEAAENGEGGEGEGGLPGLPKPGLGKGRCGGCAGNPVEGEEEHDSEDGGGKDKGKGKGEDEDEGKGKGKGDDGRSERELERMRRQVAEAVQSHIAQKGVGSVPGGMSLWANEHLRPPRVPWESKLARAIRGAIAWRPGAVDYKYDRISRRQAGVGFGPGRPVLPALRAPVPNVYVYCDTSGSMGSEEFVDGISEVRGILHACGARATFGACDAAMHEVRKVRTWQEAAAALKGGGGTSFVPIFEHAERQRPLPDVVIVITDGMGPAPEKPPPFRVVWLLVGPYRTEPCGWGEMIHLDRDGEEKEDAA